MAAVSIVGFDSAWTDRPKAPGAICSIRVERNGSASFQPPRLANFDQALSFIVEEQNRSDLCLVAVDQPTIVSNLTGIRPVERVAGSLVSYIGGGVQPANRSKVAMFGDNAPIWRFKDRLGAIENPELGRTASAGLFLIEVFPALALPAFEDRFCQRLAGPRYNPARRKTFKLADWLSVVACVASQARRLGLDGLTAWAAEAKGLPKPRKSDQDKLDAVLCALIGYRWRFAPRADSIMIGDLRSGYMVAPISNAASVRILAAASDIKIAVNGAERWDQ